VLSESRNAWCEQTKKVLGLYSMSSLWNKKTVWITGASSGIGEAFARALAPKGARLILTARNADQLEQLKQSLPNSEQHIKLALDLSDARALEAALTQHAATIADVDVLINNAGVSQRALTWEASRASERQIMETNFFGATALTKAVLPGMMERNNGLIINMSSPAGMFGFPLRSTYSASKHALHGYFETLQAELKAHRKDIHILMALPGRVRTNMSINAFTGDGTAQGKMDERLNKGLDPAVCAKRIIQAAERKHAVIYLGREQLLIFVKRFFPAIFRAIVHKFKPN
jgi:short-subunit dehydrogenase